MTAKVTRTSYVASRGTGTKDYQNKIDTNVEVNIRNLDSGDKSHESLPYDQQSLTIIEDTDGVAIGASCSGNKSSTDWGAGKDFYVTGFILEIKNAEGDGIFMDTAGEGFDLRIDENVGLDDPIYSETIESSEKKPVYYSEEDVYRLYITKYFETKIKISSTSTLYAQIRNNMGIAFSTGSRIFLKLLGMAI